MCLELLGFEAMVSIRDCGWHLEESSSGSEGEPAEGDSEAEGGSCSSPGSLWSAIGGGGWRSVMLANVSSDSEGSSSAYHRDDSFDRLFVDCREVETLFGPYDVCGHSSEVGDAETSQSCDKASHAPQTCLSGSTMSAVPTMSAVTLVADAEALQPCEEASQAPTTPPKLHLPVPALSRVEPYFVFADAPDSSSRQPTAANMTWDLESEASDRSRSPRRSLSRHRSSPSPPPFHRRPVVGALAREVAAPTLFPGCEHWQTPMHNAFASVVVKMPAKPARPLRHELLCAGAGAELNAYQVSNYG